MATTVVFEVDVKDVEYQQLDGAPFLASVYRPVGVGPFPTIVDVHGGSSGVVRTGGTATPAMT